MMTNNDIFKKLRVALMLRDDQIIEILELVDMRVTKAELGAFFRAENHPNYAECGDQILRNFLNGLVIYLRGTEENPKIPGDVLSGIKRNIPTKKTPTATENKGAKILKRDFNKNYDGKKKLPRHQVVENIKFKNGKKKT